MSNECPDHETTYDLEWSLIRLGVVVVSMRVLIEVATVNLLPSIVDVTYGAAPGATPFLTGIVAAKLAQHPSMAMLQATGVVSNATCLRLEGVRNCKPISVYPFIARISMGLMRRSLPLDDNVSGDDRGRSSGSSSTVTWIFLIVEIPASEAKTLFLLSCLMRRCCSRMRPCVCDNSGRCLRLSSSAQSPDGSK